MSNHNGARAALDPSLTWAIREGRVTYHEAMAMGARPQDFGCSDLEPEELRRAGASDRELVICGFDPVEVFEKGGSPTLLREVEPERLTEVDPDSLAAASTEDIDVGTLQDSVESVVDALPVAPTQLAQAGASVAEVAGYDLPVEEILRAGYLARDLLDAGSDVVSVLDSGAPPSLLSELDIDISVLEDVDLPAGSLRLADVPVEALLEAGYESEELLRGGFDPREIVDAGGAIEEGVRSATDLIEAGTYTPSQLRSLGVGPDMLYEEGLDPTQLLAGGYTEGELLDAGIELGELVETHADVGALRAAGVPVDELVEAGASPAALRDGGISAEQLVAAGMDEARIAAAGFAEEQLEAAGIDPEAALAAAEEITDVAVGAQRIEGIPLPRNEEELYGFSFDPASSRVDSGRSPSPETDGGYDPGMGADVDVVSGSQPLIWRVENDIERWLDRLEQYYGPAAESATEVDDEEHVVRALERESVSSKAELVDAVSLPYETNSGNRTAAANSEISDLLELVLEEELAVDELPRVAFGQQVEEEEFYIEDDAYVDDDIVTFLSILQAESIETLQYLPNEISDGVIDAIYNGLVDNPELPDDDVIDPVPTGSDARRRWCYKYLEELDLGHFVEFYLYADDVDSIEIDTDPSDVIADVVSHEVSSRDEVSMSQADAKYRTAAALAFEHGDTGVLRSFARMLFYQATMQAYFNGRLRLGSEYDDIPDGGEFGGTPPFDALFEDAPSDLVDRHLSLEATLEMNFQEATMDTAATGSGGLALDELTDSDLNIEANKLTDRLRENWGNGPAPGGDPTPDGGEETIRYYDVLAAAALEEPDTTSLAPELSEFTDSLAYLAEQDADTIETLLGETLDVTSHRVDAWWTSLATKRLFELRDDQDDPGLYIGGYGIVENLSRSADEDLEYIHTPSLQQAKTAGVLRGGYNAGENDEEVVDNPLAVDLSAERVRDAKELIRGVRRGQSLGELLGYRFERRLHEETLAEDGENVMQYRAPLREAFPGIIDSLEYLDDEDADIDERREIAKSDVVNGYRLVKHWDEEEYPYPDRLEGEDEIELPSWGSDDEWRVLDDIVEELEDDIDAVTDLLLAEGIHQLGQRNPARASGSLDALADGESLPDPDLVEIPRSETGITHRLNVLLDADSEASVDAEDLEHLRQVGEPAVDAWFEEILPAHDRIGCRVIYSWRVDGSEKEEQEEITLDELDLSGLDAVALGRNPDGEGGSELADWLTYHCRRDRPERVPREATLELELELDEPDSADVSIAAFLESARSLRSLLSESRPATGDDLTHPSEPLGPGWISDDASEMDGTIERLSERADVVEDGLDAIRDDLGDALDVFEPDRDEGTPIEEPLWETLEALDEALAEIDLDLLENVEAAVGALADADLTADLETFSEEELTGSVLDPDDATETFEAAADQEVRIPIEYPDRRHLRELHRRRQEKSAEDREVEKSGREDGTQDRTEKKKSEKHREDEIEPNVSATLLGLDGTEPFDRKPDVTVEEGVATVTADLSGRGAGTAVTIIVEVTFEDRVLDRVVRHGYVGDPRTVAGIDLDDVPDSIRALAWFASMGDRILQNEGLVALAAALSELSGEDWDAIEETRTEGYDADSPVLETADDEALEDLLDLKPVEASAALEGLHTIIGFAKAAGFGDVLDVLDRKEGHEAAVLRDPDHPQQGVYRTRIRQLLIGTPSDSGESPPPMFQSPAAFQFAPGTVAAIADTIDDQEKRTELIEALRDLLTVTPDELSELEVTGDPVDTVTRLHTWAYSPEELQRSRERSRFFGDDPADESHGGSRSSRADLDQLADDLELAFDEGPLSSLDDVIGAVDTDQIGADTVLERAAADTPASLSPTIESVRTGRPPGDAFRRVALERLRGPLVRAAHAGIYGAVPSAPASASPEDIRSVAEAARGVRGTIDRRVDAARDVEVPPDGSTDERVEFARERLEALFGDELTVFPPFIPPNYPELEMSFEDERLLAQAGPLAVETWFQRSAQVKRGVARLREPLSYAEALTDGYTRELDVAQLPYQAQADSEYNWVGADGVSPEPGRVSIVTEFGETAAPETLETGVVGLAVDEWVEQAPDDVVTTGVAIGADEPTNRPPQTMLLATPPRDGSWSTGALAEVIAETMTYADYRPVDEGDLQDLSPLVPTVSLPYFSHDHSDRTSPATVNIEPDILEWGVPWEVEPLVMKKTVHIPEGTFE